MTLVAWLEKHPALVLLAALACYIYIERRAALSACRLRIRRRP